MQQHNPSNLLELRKDLSNLENELTSIKRSKSFLSSTQGNIRKYVQEECDSLSRQIKDLKIRRARFGNNQQFHQLTTFKCFKGSGV